MSTREWIQIGLDPAEARRLGMPASLPVPKDAYDEFADTPPTFEEFVAWTREFLVEMPDHPLAAGVRVFAEKGPLWIAARAHLLEGEWEDALELLQQVLALDPDDAAAHFNLGAVYRNLGDPGRSLAEYARCEEFFADSGLFYTNRARTHEALQQLEAATDDYRKALELLPGDEFVLEQLTRLGELVELAVNPENPEETIFVTRENYLQAVEDYWATSPQTPEFFLGQAALLLDEGRAELAMQAADRALALGTDAADVWLYKGLALWRLRRHDDAIAALEAFVAREPESAAGLLNLVKVVWEQRGHAAAIPLLRRVAEFDPNNLPALQMLAATAGGEDMPGAFDRVETVRDAHPDAWAPYRVLGDLHWREEEPDAAIRAYEAALARGADDDTIAGYLAILGELERPDEMARVADAVSALERRGLALRWNAMQGYLDAGRKADAASLLRSMMDDPELSPDNRRYCEELLASLLGDASA